jgi:hypothetical protein
MTVTWPPSMIPGSAAVAEPFPPAAAMARQWAAVHQAAGIVAMLAGVPADPLALPTADFPATMQSAGGWRLALAAQGVDDLAAVMKPGLAALLAIHHRGADPGVAALALWEEIAAARAALLAMAAPLA